VLLFVVAFLLHVVPSKAGMAVINDRALMLTYRVAAAAHAAARRLI
jgi:hypothetical protein